MTAALIVVTACAVALGGVLVVDVAHRRRRFAAATVDRSGVGTSRRRRPTDARAAVEGTAPDGSPLTLELAAHGGRTLLVFLTSSCVTCRGLWAELRSDLARRLPEGTAVLIVTEDPAQERAAVVRDLAPGAVPVVMSSATWRRFGVTAAPFLVLVEGGSGRLLAADTASDGGAVLRFVQSPTGV